MTTQTQTKATWAIDPSHSEVMFKVKHLVISTVTGYFRSFEGGAETEGDDFTTAKVWFKADVNSIGANSAQRDGHLKSADFFDAESHPNLTFESTSITGQGDGKYLVKGMLTMRGVTKEVELHAEHGGVMLDPWGLTRTGFEMTGEINRKDWGLHWHVVTDNGGLVAGDKVKLHVNAELTKQA